MAPEPRKPPESVETSPNPRSISPVAGTPAQGEATRRPRWCGYCPMLTNLLKVAYIEDAERGFTLPERPQTISRLTLITGIHRKM